jgi:uncharacterized protein YdaU (DUF1376 family)
MVAFYKHHIPDWMNGTEKLSDGAYRAYHVICQLIYLNEGPIVLNERGIAGRCNQSVRAFTRHLAELIDATKVTLENGVIFNSRAEKELEILKTNRENGKTGGEISGKVRKEAAKSLNGKGSSEAPLQVDRSASSRARTGETRLDSSSLRSEAPAEPDAARSPTENSDARTLLFRDGLAKLAAISGRTETKLRAVLGRWLRDVDDDALRILTLIAKADRDRPADPIGWIEGHFRRQAEPPAKDQFGRAIRRRN